MIDEVSRGELVRRAVLLEYITLGWNVVGSVILLAVALWVHSVALAGFGLDSVVEVAASMVVIRQLMGGALKDERPSLLTIAALLCALSLYILIQSLLVLEMRTRPASSLLGACWLEMTMLVMLALAAAKKLTARRLGSALLAAEARITFIDALLAGATLTGVMLNAVFGWWWADPLAALVIVVYAVSMAADIFLKSPAIE